MLKLLLLVVALAHDGRAALFDQESEDEAAAAVAAAEAGAAGGWQGWMDGAVAKVKEALPEPSEAKKILPLGLMLFFILFDYTILRDTKDVLVVTAPSSGAEVIPFLKTYVNLPGAVAFTVLYSKLCNAAEQERVFYTVIGFFLSFFAVFAAFLYPNRDVLSTAVLADSMQAFLPQGLSALSSIVRNWTFSLFYLMSELWGSVVVSVLFWGFANDIVSVSEAKRFYPLFGLGANLTLVFSGRYMRLVSSIRQSLPPDVDKWGVSLQLLMGAVVTGGLVVAGCYRWMQENVITDPECVDADSAAGMKETTSLTLKESAAFLGANDYLRDVAILVIAYGTSINIVEVTWKAKLKMAYPDPNDYSAFMGNFSSTTGLVTLGMMLLGGQVFKNYGWGTAAKATPVVLLLTGVGFFSLSMFGDAAPMQEMLGALSTNPLTLAVLAGAAQNVLSKSCKYSLFDPCKEMAYIPLSQEEKRKGKAAVDVIGNPLGKSTGSFVQQGLFLATGSLQASTPYLAGVLLAVITTWLFAADSLSKKFEAAMELVGDTIAPPALASASEGPRSPPPPADAAAAATTTTTASATADAQAAGTAAAAGQELVEEKEAAAGGGLGR
ncbi:plastidic ATP/ADP transporter [Ectocarpus siliculosus]|uniref:ADP,ATP carrier protein n=1 Tax=Ectocarpus siliculosus TaxID=2880 RepID=D7FNV6_ECTSI|nr:plastidic ATP/ADP transporter [Ectocarpus siliculosus]|eukprot:CBJ30232.1 plastidic ATP/ADP transporter [Ectocarpus siliculosus]